MTDARLEAKRASNEPKCANCAHWEGRDNETAIRAECPRVVAVTLDLAVCSAWERHEVHYGRILRNDEVIDDER